MTFKEEIDLQSRDNKMLSYEILSQLKDKTYFSGRSKEIGDSVLFGMIQEEDEDGEVVMKLITFHEEEVNSLYEEDSRFYKQKKTNKLPHIKKIKNGD
jgi:hypothetical protein